MNRRCVLLISGLTLLTAACGQGGTSGVAGGGTGGPGPDPGGGSGTSPPVPVTALNLLSPAELTYYQTVFRPDFAAVSAAAIAEPQTPFGSPVVSGNVTYAGYMQLIMGNQLVSANVIGNATLQLNLSTQAISGSADGFQGATTDEYDFAQVAHYEGIITISDGAISQSADGHYAVGMGVDGVLDNGLNSFAISGDLIGSLYGAEAEGLRVIGSYTNIHGSMDVTIDGVDTPQDIGIGTISALKQ